jgi:hypothetical protein
MQPVHSSPRVGAVTFGDMCSQSKVVQEKIFWGKRVKYLRFITSPSPFSNHSFGQTKWNPESKDLESFRHCPLRTHSQENMISRGKWKTFITIFKNLIF